MNDFQAMTQRELAQIIHEGQTTSDPQFLEALHKQARAVRDAHYGPRVFLRGLVECSSICTQNCLYCGLRRENHKAERTRLSQQQILQSCRGGYALGFRTFVLQGGEDPHFTDEKICALIHAIKTEFPTCALTLSMGEKPAQSYSAFRSAGADRYLLRHETATSAHYAALHPAPQTWESRRRCLFTLRELGFQTGAGFMVGSPCQTAEHLAADLVFLRELQPHMVGIGPFLPHKDTPFASQPPGRLQDTLLMLSLTRLLLPAALLPATTALASMHPTGREQGLRAGANVVMPNLSPPDMRDAYHLYNGKLHTGAEAAEGLRELCRCIESTGMQPDFSRGDFCAAANAPSLLKNQSAHIII